MKDSEKGLGKSALQIAAEAMNMIVSHANGDARRALNVLEAAHDVVTNRNENQVKLEIVEGIIQQAATLYDKNGTEHYRSEEYTSELQSPE